MQVAEEELKTRDEGKHKICKTLPRMGSCGPPGSLGKQRLLCREEMMEPSVEILGEWRVGGATLESH